MYTAYASKQLIEIRDCQSEKCYIKAVQISLGSEAEVAINEVNAINAIKAKVKAKVNVNGVASAVQFIWELQSAVDVAIMPDLSNIIIFTDCLKNAAKTIK